MTVTINGSSGITAPEVILDNTTADGGQVVLKSSGYSNWNLDNYSGRFRAYYNSTEYFTVTNSGNVGIGTSSPSAKLDVSGSAAAASLTLSNFGSATTAVVGFGDGNTGLFRPAANTIGFTANGTEQARITSDGLLQFNSGYGSVATAYGCRAWVNFNGQGTVSIRASGNVSSITDNGVGDYRLNFTTSMPDANYSWSLAGSSHLNDSTTNAVMVGRTTTSEQTAASLRLDTVRSQGSSMDNQDMALVTVTIFR